jgi:hypothetical protein
VGAPGRWDWGEMSQTRGTDGEGGFREDEPTATFIVAARTSGGELPLRRSKERTRGMGGAAARVARGRRGG